MLKNRGRRQEAGGSAENCSVCVHRGQAGAESEHWMRSEKRPWDAPDFSVLCAAVWGNDVVLP